MKRVCILSAVNIKHMSMISVYTDELIKNGIEFDLIYMDKYGENEPYPAKHIYRYINVVNPHLPKYIRGLKYFKFFGYAKKILENNKYDFIIVWNDVAIFLFGKYLAKKWSGKYCLNIRDYCHQKIHYIYNIFEQAIEASAFTTLSSPGYEDFLPQYNYVYLNSLNMNVLSKCTERKELVDDSKPIRITFVGYVRFYEINKRLLDIFKNDSRFELHYYGMHSEVLKEYANENGIKNAVFGEGFPVQDTAKYIDKIDIINNLYGHGNMSVDYALSIKLYYGIFCKLPILVEPNTYMEDITTEYGMGFVVNELSDDLNDRIFRWYKSLDFNNMKEKCDDALLNIKQQNALFLKRLNEYVDEKH